MEIIPFRNNNYSSITSRQPNFSAKYAVSDKGVVYQETNMAKQVACVVGATIPIISMIIAGVIKKKIPDVTVLTTTLVNIVPSSLLWLGIGTLIDMGINYSRAKAADDSLMSQNLYY